MSVAMSLAEMGSALPTSGGVYFWTHKYAPPRWKNLLSWICGYCDTIGNMAGITSADWGCAVQLMAAVSIGTNMTFVPTTAQLFGVFAAIITCHVFIASLETTIVAKLQSICVILNVVLWLALMIALPIATPAQFRNSSEFALRGFTNLGSWPKGWAFVLSFLYPLWTINGLSSPAHVSEEASNASIAVPWGIFSAAATAGVLGFALNLVIAFFMGNDIEGIMASPIGQPMAAILLNSLGKRGALTIWSIVVLVQFLTGASIAPDKSLVSLAMVLFQDLDTCVASTNTRVHLSTRSFWLRGALILGSLAFAGTTAVAAVFSISITGQYAGYIITISTRFFGGYQWIPGPFNLRSWGRPVALVAVLWMAFGIVVLAFARTPKPTGMNLNYTAPVFCAVVIISVLYYYVPVYGGIHWFKGPKNTIETVIVDDENSVEKDGKETKD